MVKKSQSEPITFVLAFLNYFAQTNREGNDKICPVSVIEFGEKRIPVSDISFLKQTNLGTQKYKQLKRITVHITSNKHLSSFVRKSAFSKHQHFLTE